MICRRRFVEESRHQVLEGLMEIWRNGFIMSPGPQECNILPEGSSLGVLMYAGGGCGRNQTPGTPRYSQVLKGLVLPGTQGADVSPGKGSEDVVRGRSRM